MKYINHFFRWLTGFSSRQTANLSEHLRRRLSLLGALMLFVAIINGSILITSLLQNAYPLAGAISAGLGLVAFTLLVERLIVSSINRPNYVSFLYRTLLFTVLVGVHLVFVDLALHYNALSKIGHDRNEQIKANRSAPVEAARLSFVDDIIRLDERKDSLDADRAKEWKMTILEIGGEISGEIGYGPLAATLEAKFAEYDTTIYLPAVSEINTRRQAAVAGRDSLARQLLAIADEPYEYDDESLITKLMFMDQYLKEPGNEKAWYVMLLLLLTVAAMEFAVLFARSRLEDDEIRAQHEATIAMTKRLAQARVTTQTRAGLRQEQIKRRADERKQPSDFLHLQADDITAHHLKHVSRVVAIDREQRKKSRRQSGPTKDKINDIFNRLRKDLDELFARYNPHP